MQFSRISGTGSYLPETILTNHQLSEMVDTSDSWIVERTGISERRIAGPHEDVISMGTIAAQRALETAQCHASDVELILVATSTAYSILPSAACSIQRELNIPASCFAFDMNAACSGFVYAMTVADQFIRAGSVKNALVIGSEVMSRVVDWTDRSTCVIFADGAGAVFFTADEKPGILETKLYSDGEYSHSLCASNPQFAPKNKDVNPYISMEGSRIFKLAVPALEQVVDAVLAPKGLSKESIDWLVPHQANIRILQATAKKLNMPMERVICTLQYQGNTSSASIPLALDTGIRDGRIQRGHRLLMESFGGGLTWGAVLVDY